MFIKQSLNRNLQCAKLMCNTYLMWHISCELNCNIAPQSRTKIQLGQAAIIMRVIFAMHFYQTHSGTIRHQKHVI